MVYIEPSGKDPGRVRIAAKSLTRSRVASVRLARQCILAIDFGVMNGSSVRRARARLRGLVLVRERCAEENASKRARGHIGRG